MVRSKSNFESAMMASDKFGIVNVCLDLEGEKFGKTEVDLNGNQTGPRGEEGTKLIWDNLSFKVDLKRWSLTPFSLLPKTTEKTILQRQHGHVAAGQLVGIIGPSGAGKSTLLNCLTGRNRVGLSGRVYVQNSRPVDKKEKRQITIAVIPQRDNLFEQFTVKETLIFASKIKNGLDFDHEAEAVKVIKYLNLETCAKTYMKKCSGGQLKRVCIGVELVSQPDILVLDEPTTGLDSSTAYQVISILRKLSESKDKPPAILATIHQPSSKLLKQFHQIYLLSKTGRCLYFGPPSGLKDHFRSAGLDCPSDYNPADFAIETAYGDYGEDVYDKLEFMNNPQLSLKSHVTDQLGGDGGREALGTSGRYQPRDASTHSLDSKSSSSSEDIKITTVVKKMKDQKFPYVHHLYLLLVRNLRKIGRDPGQLYLRLFQNIAIGLMVSYLWNPDIGSEDGCWADFLDTKSANVSNAKNAYLTKISRINSNSALLFSFLIYVVMVSVMSTVLSFPTETCVIIKEMKNNWYSCATYYWAKFLAELPILFLTILVLASIIYPLTGQIAVWWRFGMFYFVTCLMGEVCQTIGMLFGTIFSDDLISACFGSVASGFPPILFGGFVVQVAQIRWYLKPLTYVSYVRYAFESLVITIYGYDRCGAKIGANFADKIATSSNPIQLIGTLVQNFNLTSKDAGTFSALLGVDGSCVESVINGTIDYFGLSSGPVGDEADDYDDGGDNATTVASVAPSLEEANYEESSYVLNYFSLKEESLVPNIMALLFYIVILKFLTYYILQRKTRL
ncbi:ATP-binding cassette sub-family G member 1 [Halotydeus destructor]|nr:ATP-binding cassette sub-family G member 1 [Halotydeus destructor]